MGFAALPASVLVSKYVDGVNIFPVKQIEQGIAANKMEGWDGQSPIFLKHGSEKAKVNCPLAPCKADCPKGGKCTPADNCGRTDCPVAKCPQKTVCPLPAAK